MEFNSNDLNGTSESLLLIKAAIVVGHSLFCPFRVLPFRFPPPIPCSAHSVQPILILIPPYNRRLAKIKKIHMAPRGFEPMTSQANASSSYHYTICVFMSTSIIENTSTTSLPNPTCYPCTMRSIR
jgi:hypothetical protein